MNPDIARQASDCLSGIESYKYIIGVLCNKYNEVNIVAKDSKYIFLDFHAKRLLIDYYEKKLREKQDELAKL